MTHRQLVVVVLFGAIFSFDLARPTDIDFWWHLRTGELIAQTGSVPTTDPFSFTAQGRSWVAHEWLWELITYLTYRSGGYVAAVLASAVIVTLAYVLLYRLLRRLGANEILSAVLVLWAAALALPNLGVRPREITFLFTALYLGRLLLYREGRVSHLWPLPAAMLLWVNLHGGFVLGLGLVALFIAGEFLDRSRTADRRRHLLLVGAATLVAAAVNPVGPRLLVYPFGYYLWGENPSFSIVTEFASPNFHEPLLLLFAAGMIVLMVLGVRRGHRLDALLAGVFTLQALLSARQVALCAMVMAPLLALVACERFRWASELAPPHLPSFFRVLNTALLITLVAGAIVYGNRPDIRARLQLGAEPIPGSMPVEGARFIEDQQLPDPVFHHQIWGGYLIRRWYPARRVFIDGRIDMYGPTIVGDYIRIVNVQPGWSETLERYGAGTVLVPKESPLSLLLLRHDGWERVFQGPVEDVFVRMKDEG